MLLMIGHIEVVKLPANEVDSRLMTRLNCPKRPSGILNLRTRSACHCSFTYATLNLHISPPSLLPRCALFNNQHLLQS